MRLLLSILLLIAMRCGHVAAQSCAVVEYTTREGLPSGTYTYSYQDKSGYLWVGTYAAGAARFDGKKWKIFTIEDGLQANKVDLCWQDTLGRVWFDHGQYGMTMLDKAGKFNRFKPSTARQKEIERSAVAPNGQICFFDHQTREIYRFDPETGQKKPFGIQLPKDTASHSSILHLNDNNNLEGAIFMPRRERGQPFLFFKFATHRWQLLSDQPPVNVLDFADALDFPIVGDFKNIWFFQDNSWKALQPPSVQLLDGREVQPANNIQYTHVDHFNRKIYVTWKLDKKNATKPRYLLAEYDAHMRLVATCLFATYHLPAQITKDKAGTYWIACQTALLRVFPQMQNIPLDAPNMLPQTWSVAQAPDSQMWFASYGEGLARFDGLDVHPQPDFLKPFTRYDDGSLVDRQTGDMYFNIEGAEGFGGLLRFDGKKTWRRFSDGIMSTYLAYDKKGRLMRGTFYKGLWLLPNGADISDDHAWEKIDQSKGLEFNSTIHTALEDRYGRYWIGHLNTGLACFDPKSEKIWNWTKSRHGKNYGVMSMAEDGHGNLWLGTDQGLFFLPLPENMDSQFDVTAQLRRIVSDYTGTSLVSVCRLYDENTLLIGNSEGFFLLDVRAFYKGSTLIYSFVPSTGHLLGNVNQNGVWIDHQKRIWLTCSGGVTCFDPALWVRDTSLPLVFVDSIKVGNNMFKNFSERFSLERGPRFFQIYFHASPDPMLFDNTRFEYQFTGDSTWTKVPPGTESLTFQNLDEGIHYFNIRIDKGGTYSKSTIQQIYVPYWWQNLVLWLALLLAAIVIGLLWQRINLQKARQQIEVEKDKHETDKLITDQNLQIAQHQLQLEKSLNHVTRIDREKNMLQVQAIVNQLNPHFINNALHWLQGRLDGDEEAVRVVGKLSENIGTVFTNSRKKKSYHSLREEMKLAENYLYIQKCRFKDKLHYQMPSPDMLASLETMLVPLMAVQIHIENAIEHGIRNNRTGAGEVIINLQEEDSYVIITIQDDGVGRPAAKKIGSEGTQQGVKMLKELEIIYNRQNELPLEQYYEDNIFVDADGRIYGTRVVVRLPKEYNFEF